MPKDICEDVVIIVSVFIHPEAQDTVKIYKYNYGATKLALTRAMENFPSVDKVTYEKDRGVHAIMGYKITRLWDPPYLQIAIDAPDLGVVERVLKNVPKNDHVIIEAGTPLIKRYGLSVISKIRELRKDAFVVADLKTLDTGNLEARMAADATADAVVCSGLAPVATIEKFIEEARKVGIYSIIDTLNVENPAKLIASLKVKPDIVELHRGIDTEGKAEHAWGNIHEIKKAAGGKKLLVAVARRRQGSERRHGPQGRCGHPGSRSCNHERQGHRGCIPRVPRGAAQGRDRPIPYNDGLLNGGSLPLFILF